MVLPTGAAKPPAWVVDESEMPMLMGVGACFGGGGAVGGGGACTLGGGGRTLGGGGRRTFCTGLGSTGLGSSFLISMGLGLGFSTISISMGLGGGGATMRVLASHA